MRTIAHHDNLATLVAPDCVVAPKDFDFKRIFRYLVKYCLRVKGAVIIAYTRMISPDDEIRAAAILAEYGVQQRLARARRIACRNRTR